jgi:cytochrome P450
VLGEGLLTSEGEFHLRQRRLIQPLFHRRHLARYDLPIADLIAGLSSRWADGETREITRDMWDFTVHVIARTMFNSTVEEEADEISRALSNLTRLFNPLMLFFVDWLARVLNPLMERYHRARAELDQQIYHAGGNSGDLPRLLHDAQLDAEGNEVFPPQQIRDEELTIFLAGLGTTSYALTRTWYLLSQHPAIEQLFHAELDSVLGRRAPLVSDVEQLVFTRRVLTESMRLYPPSWITDREPLQDYEMRGCHIPPGSSIMLSQWVTHHDHRFFADPFRFDPDRWLPERKRCVPEFAYFPFGGGPRLCIGEPMAWMVGPLALATIGQRWRLRLSPEHPLDLLPRFSWDPKDTMYIRLKKR